MQSLVRGIAPPEGVTTVGVRTTNTEGANAMTGKAREHEVRIMGFGLAAVAVLATFLAIWFAASLGAQLRSHASDASVTSGTGGASLAGAFVQR